MVKEKKSQKASSNNPIFSNWYVQFLMVTLLGAIITFLVWKKGLILTIFKNFNVSNEEQARVILKHNHSPITFYFMIGFGFACVVMLIKLLFEKRQDKKKDDDDYEDD